MLGVSGTLVKVQLGNSRIQPRCWDTLGGRSRYLVLSSRLCLASHGAHRCHGSHGLGGHGLQLRGRPGQRGQGCGLGQRLEHWAGLGQSACNRARHISPSTMRCRSIDGFIYADQNSNSQELNFLVRTIELMRIRFSAYMKKGADFF